MSKTSIGKEMLDQAVDVTKQLGVTGLKTFRLVYNAQSSTDNPTAKVFANGRQQVHIEVHIDARDADGVHVDLPSDFVNNISLFSYDKSTDINFIGGWKSSRIKDIYDPFPVSKNEAPGEVVFEPESYGASGVESKNTLNIFSLWATTTSLEALRISAVARLASGAEYQTNHRDVPAGGEGHQGKFNSSVTVQPVRPEVYDADHFELERIDEKEQNNMDVDLYFVSLKNKQMRIVSSFQRGYNENGMYYSWPKSPRKIQFAHPVAPAESQFTYRTTGDTGAFITYRINYRPGKATAARIIDRNRNNHRGPQLSTDAQMTYTDNFGNEHQIRLFHSSNGNTIHLSNPRSAEAEDDVSAPIDDPAA
ncbi:hypothetical protein PTE30175_01208 [Pandoraea terrae]|uniref:Uncharacterized protein n=1 Tax=Pandoraea terrae TaxID=1537710 RepID=A0A5E4TC66_9BURK|nr:hypothetical protein [Pandoraea terrae]VVD84118.1 hypothetical protein PTE30175_01208 [Pandoraea terrae]